MSSSQQLNGEPPPSTVAAQIVQRPTNSGDNQTHLRQLLQEILDADSNGTSTSGSVELSLDVNYRLIYIIVRAGLEALSSNSSQDQSEVRSQAVNTLAVVELTVRRVPGILLYIPQDIDRSIKPGGPIFLWLIPYLVNLLHDGIDYRIRAAATKALGTSISARTPPSRSMITSHPVLKFVQGCIKDLIHFTQAAEHAGSSKATLPSFQIPTIETVSEVFPQFVYHAIQVKSCVQHEDSSRNVFTLVQLLLMLSSLKTPQKKLSASKAIGLESSWLIDSLQGIYPLFSGPKTSIISKASHVATYDYFLKALRACHSYVLCDQYDIVAVSRISILMCKAVNYGFRLEPDLLACSHESEVSWIMFDLLCSVRKHSFVFQIVREHLCFFLQDIVPSDVRVENLGNDLRRVLKMAMQPVYELTQNLHHSVKALQDEQLKLAFQRGFEISERSITLVDTLRPLKRLRLSEQVGPINGAAMQIQLIRSIYDVVKSPPVSDLQDLGLKAVHAFETISEDDQCKFFELVGQLPCTNAETFASSRGICCVCDSAYGMKHGIAHLDSVLREELISALTNVVGLPQVQRSLRPRVAAMIALRHILLHAGATQHLNLGSTPLGQWCLRSLRSSQRDLRIAAGRTLICFVRDAIEPKQLRTNRILAFDFLRNQADVSDLALHESCILAWGQVASCISSEDETNIVLLRLIEYLGHTNPMISGFAYDELLKLTSHTTLAAIRLFEPYWRTIAVTVIKDLQSRPQIAQRVCDLLNIEVTALLRMTQYHTIPFLVLTKKRDILQRIADANETDHSIYNLCMEPLHLAAILSCLLLQYPKDTENMVVNSLCEASPDFRNFDLTHAAFAHPMLIALELLKVSGEEDEGRSARAHQALRYLAGLTQHRSGSMKSATRKSEVIGKFFESYVLAIMALLSDTISETKGFQPVSERRRCVSAIRDMVQLAKSHISNALPQISACLRAAIEDEALCNDGLRAWIGLLGTLPAEEIEPLIDPTFAILAQHWESFNPTMQQAAYEMISRLLKTHGGMIRDIVSTIPSLAHIPLMSKFEDEIGKLKAQMDVKHQLQAFVQRCQTENVTVATRALTELEHHLHDHQSFVYAAKVGAQPDPVISQLIRSLLDVCVRFNHTNTNVAILCAKCLGLIGCVDHNRVEAIKESREILVESNFDKAEETIDFVVFFIQEVLVKVFLSATNTRAQSFLGYAIQELLQYCQFDTSVMIRSGDIQTMDTYRRWVAIPESVRNTLAPFLTSKYFLTPAASLPDCVYPIYNTEKTHRTWLQDFVFDLLRNGTGNNAPVIFSVCRRVVRGQDISISSFLLPFAALNVIVGGTEQQNSSTSREFLAVLSQLLPENNQVVRDNLIMCSQNVFQALDYFSRWVHEKKKSIKLSRSAATRAGRTAQDVDYEREMAQISAVESVLKSIPAEIMSRRAVECKSFARALFYWEQYIQEQKDNSDVNTNLDPLYEKLQDIYSQIDEPDGIEEHRKAGRWTAVQSWYELLLTERPEDPDVQFNLLTSLKESGQHDVLLNQVAGLPRSEATTLMSRPFAIEAAWVTGKWDKLEQILPLSTTDYGGDFVIGIGMALRAMHQKDREQFQKILDSLRESAAKSMSTTNTTSLQACHDIMLKFHILTEVQSISGSQDSETLDRNTLMVHLNQRLDALGAFSADKQYVLGLRRASMQLSWHKFSFVDLSSTWLTSARLARKANFTHQAFNSVLHASRLGDSSATIEHSRLLWREGQHRKAIQSLEGVIAINSFQSHNYVHQNESTATNPQDQQQRQNVLTAKAHLLLAKWIDHAGQTQSDVIIQEYKKAVDFHNRWEKGHYYLGKHYNKLLESEKAKVPAKQAQVFITGETAKLVIENYLRSLAFGAKYIYQTLPRIITLWLELGVEVEKQLDPKHGNDEDFRTHTGNQRRKLFSAVTAQTKKYIDRLPAFVWYTAFTQIVARICHPNQTVYGSLLDIIAKVVLSHPQQALWALLALVKSSAKDRFIRGAQCVTKILENAKRVKTEMAGMEIKSLLQQGQRLSDQLLHVCEGEVKNKVTQVSLSADLRFTHKLAPCRLVIPLESTLTASLPPVTDTVIMKAHKAFSKDTVTISSFLDDVLVLTSLIRPKKVSVRGSDGRVYGLLCKPKDDLRKDQRLLEFNAMINRLLKKDAECSKRRLYIKTYAVTPLNETCGLIEWVDNLKTLRDILIKIYKERNIAVNFIEIRNRLDAACSDISQISIFTDEILSKFPPVFHEWFVEMFPEPGAWFTARLKYTRSAAVMSIVGHVLGLGDRHGENILFEEGDGHTFHVDFNCLFDKGLTFEKPELVPFRLTHNMVDAFGAYGYDGPFRKSCELTLAILRLNDDTLMTVLETFLYDPTTDFIGKKKRNTSNVPNTPEGVLESVRNKVRGLLPMESVPLSVEGYVQELIQRATDPMKLASMYIGWCAFF